MLSRLKIRSGMARMMVMIPHQKMGKYTTSRLFVAWARQARAQASGEATRNMPGSPKVMAVSRNPALTVVTETPARQRREAGSATCRDKVSQTVEITGVAETLEKKRISNK